MWNSLLADANNSKTVIEFKTNLQLFYYKRFQGGASFVFFNSSLPSVMSVYCSLVVTCWERADLFALLFVTFSCAFLTFPYGVLGQVWYLIVSIPDICLLPYFDKIWLDRRYDMTDHLLTFMLN